MGMNLGSGASAGDEPEVMMDINTTPLIDVMLVLIIMLIITIPVQLHSVNLNMPQGNPPPTPVEPEVVAIDIGADGTILWQGEPLNSRADLEKRLSETAARAPQPEVHLRPHKRVDYGAVAAVLASAQRLGVVKLGMVGNEQFAP